MFKYIFKYLYFFVVVPILPFLVQILIVVITQPNIPIGEILSLDNFADAFKSDYYEWIFMLAFYMATYFVSYLIYKWIKYKVFILPAIVGLYLISFLTSENFSMRDGGAVGIVVMLIIIITSSCFALSFIVYYKWIEQWLGFKKRINDEQFRVSRRPKSKFDW